MFVLNSKNDSLTKDEVTVCYRLNLGYKVNKESIDVIYLIKLSGKNLI